MNTKARITKAEREIKAASKAQTSGIVSLQVKPVNYRAGLSAEYPEPADTTIKIRHIDMTIQYKDGDQ